MPNPYGEPNKLLTWKLTLCGTLPLGLLGKHGSPISQEDGYMVVLPKLSS